VGAVSYERGTPVAMHVKSRLADQACLACVLQIARGAGFRGGLVFKAHRLVFHSTLGWGVIKKKEEEGVRGLPSRFRGGCCLDLCHPQHTFSAQGCFGASDCSGIPLEPLIILLLDVTV